MNIGLLSNLTRENAINNNKIVGNSLEKLSTGLRINKASDDASGLAISDKLRTQATGVKQGIDNANSAIAMMNIADKSMDELSNILDTIKAKAIQMNTDTTSDEGRKIIKTDILKLIDSYDDIVCRTNYNQTPLLNGCSSPFTFQVGDNSSDIISVDIDSVEARHMGEPDPYKLKNFITGFNTPVVAPPPSIGSDTEGAKLINGLTNLTGTLESKPKGEFMIEIPAGLTNLTIYLDELQGGGIAGGDAIQIFTKDGKHISGTDSTSEDWQHFIKNPADIITNNPTKFNIGANYQNRLSDNANLDLTYYGPYHGDGNPTLSVNVSYVDKDGNSQIKIVGQDEEMVVIKAVTEPLVVFINGGGVYRTSAEWEEGSLPLNPIDPDEENLSCGCDYTDLTRNDDSPTLVIQARNLMKVIDEALSQLNSQRANVGAGTNQLESSARNHLTSYVNLKNAESIIRDVDYSEESANFNKANIISQAGSYALSQANEIDKQSVSQLLK
ncbi:MAG: hypothetical protein KA073_03580 [Aliarcobacter sp.]|nr:hypothetical protein [Aliarcobacter sp.]